MAVGSLSVGFCGTCVTGGFWEMLSFTGCSTLACKKTDNVKVLVLITSPGRDKCRSQKSIKVKINMGT